MLGRNVLAFLAVLFVGYTALLIITWLGDAGGYPLYVKEATIAMAGGVIGGMVYAFLEEVKKDSEVKVKMMSVTSRLKNGCLVIMTLGLLCIFLGSVFLIYAPPFATETRMFSLMSSIGFFLIPFGTAFFIAGINCHRFDEIERKLDAMQPKP